MGIYVFLVYIGVKIKGVDRFIYIDKFVVEEVCVFKVVEF